MLYGSTLFDYAETNTELSLHGSSLRGLLEGQEDAARKFARGEWELLAPRAGVALSLHVIRTKKHKLTVDRISGAGELYDLANVPSEMVNQYDNEAFASVRQNIERMMKSRPDNRMEIQTQVGQV